MFLMALDEVNMDRKQVVLYRQQNPTKQTYQKILISRHRIKLLQGLGDDEGVPAKCRALSIANLDEITERQSDADMSSRDS